MKYLIVIISTILFSPSGESNNLYSMDDLIFLDKEKSYRELKIGQKEMTIDTTLWMLLQLHLLNQE